MHRSLINRLLWRLLQTLPKNNKSFHTRQTMLSDLRWLLPLLSYTADAPLRCRPSLRSSSSTLIISIVRLLSTPRFDTFGLQCFSNDWFIWRKNQWYSTIIHLCCIGRRAGGSLGLMNVTNLGAANATQFRLRNWKYSQQCRGIPYHTEWWKKCQWSRR